MAALRLLAKAEGELRCAGAADFGVPAMLEAAPVLVEIVREKVAAVFGVKPIPMILPDDAP
jgi:hypothetical protein